MMTDHAMRSQRHPKLRRTVVLFAASIGAACHYTWPVAEVMPPDIPAWVRAMAGPHGFSPDFVAACAQMGWSSVCDDPVYTDDQKLRDDLGGYGPHAYITPSVSLKTKKTIADFATPQLVGFVFVEPSQIAASGLPNTYKDLRLAGGVNCLFLQQTGGNFAAYVTNTSNCLTAVPNLAQPLSVQAIPNPSAFSGGSETDQADRIPPVARFHEATKLRVEGAPILGLRCGSKWCLMMAPNSGLQEEQPPHSGEHQDVRTWAIHGWSDAQHLALLTTGGPIVRSDLRASIIPDPDLSTHVWDANISADGHGGDGQFVATVRFKGAPVGRYLNNWHFKDGVNKLYVWRDPSGAWKGEIQNKSGLTTKYTKVYVDQRHVGTNPPWTARFRWDPNDEEIWVACAGGCCYVSAYY